MQKNELLGDLNKVQAAAGVNPSHQQQQPQQHMGYGAAGYGMP